MKLAGLVHLVTARELELARERVAICVEASEEPTAEEVRNAEGLAWDQIKQQRARGTANATDDGQ